MRRQLTFYRWARLAYTIWSGAGDEAIDAQIAFGWAIIHRSNYALRFHENQGQSHPIFGSGSIGSACRTALDQDRISCRPRRVGGTTDRLFWRASAAAYLVLSGDIPDPIKGAPYFHHHDLTPDWIGDMEVVALIGNRFYYHAKMAPEKPSPDAN